MIKNAANGENLWTYGLKLTAWSVLKICPFAILIAAQHRRIVFSLNLPLPLRWMPKPITQSQAGHLKSLLIEDEQPAARQLTKLLAQLDPPLTVVGVLDSVESAVRWLRAEAPPELVFMDIQIADGPEF